jgi:multidrug efflux pump subunit AcrB
MPTTRASRLANKEETALPERPAGELGAQLLGVPGLSNVGTTASLERPEIIVRPDFRRAAERGLTTAAIGEVVRIATSGDFDAQVARLNLDGRQVYMRVRIADAARQSLETLANMRVRGRDGPVSPSSVRLIQSGDAETAVELASGFGVAIVVACSCSAYWRCFSWTFCCLSRSCRCFHCRSVALSLRCWWRAANLTSPR